MTESAQIARGCHAHLPTCPLRPRRFCRHGDRGASPRGRRQQSLRRQLGLARPGQRLVGDRPQVTVSDLGQHFGPEHRQRGDRHRADCRPVHRLRGRHRLRLRHLQCHHEHPPRGRKQPDPRQRPKLDVRRPHRLRRHHDVPAQRQFLRRTATRHARRHVGRRHGQGALCQRHQRRRTRCRRDRHADGAGHPNRRRRPNQQRDVHGPGEPRQRHCRTIVLTHAHARRPDRQRRHRVGICVLPLLPVERQRGATLPAAP